jgi:hypothetical protein
MELSFSDSLLDEPPDGVLKLEVIGVEIEKRGPLRWPIVDGVHQPYHLYIFHKKGEYLIGEVKQPFGDTPPLPSGAIKESIKLSKGSTYQFEIDPLFISKVVIEDGFGHSSSGHDLSDRGSRVTFPGKQFNGACEETLTDRLIGWCLLHFCLRHFVFHLPFSRGVKRASFVYLPVII